ncbi:Uncharacterized protein Rs2_30001 [Raphanus sativus]|nr:Uncharacterized protein Rs2_30001 [Raphanus sativus]
MSLLKELQRVEYLEYLTIEISSGMVLEHLLSSHMLVKCIQKAVLFRGARSPAAEALQIHLTTVTLPSLQASEDNYTWRVNDTSLDSFSTKHSWEVLRQRAPLQLRTLDEWFKGAIPRHAFLLKIGLHHGP